MGVENGIELSTISMPDCGKRGFVVKILFRALKFLQKRKDIFWVAGFMLHVAGHVTCNMKPVT
jgi:hypothetical protein